MKNMMVRGFQVTKEQIEKAISELRTRDEFTKKDVIQALQHAGVPELHRPTAPAGLNLKPNFCSSIAAARVLAMGRELQIFKYVGKGLWNWR